MTLTNITPEAHALHCHARSHRMPSDMETGPTAKPLKRCDARHALSRLRPKDRAMPLGLRMQSGKLNERLLGKGAALKLTPKRDNVIGNSFAIFSMRGRLGRN